MTNLVFLILIPIPLTILIRRRNVKKIEIHFLEEDHFNGVLNDMANEKLQ